MHGATAARDDDSSSRFMHPTPGGIRGRTDYVVTKVRDKLCELGRSVEKRPGVPARGRKKLRAFFPIKLR